jgi:hypothetical protein
MNNKKITYQTGRIWSILQAEPLNFKILVTADIAFSVGFIFSTVLHSGWESRDTIRGTA